MDNTIYTTEAHIFTANDIWYSDKSRKIKEVIFRNCGGKVVRLLPQDGNNSIVNLRAGINLNARDELRLFGDCFRDESWIINFEAAGTPALFIILVTIEKP